ncbi:unnamed protein product [Rhizophagus irregularis]|nr:unnamed protein product [Rhizophagus irregularis]
MNRNFIFVFILLATLSMVNAIPLHKRATVFGKCPPIPGLPTQPEEISVSISPDPVVPGQTDTFTVSGKLSPMNTSFLLDWLIFKDYLTLLMLRIFLQLNPIPI